MKYFIYVIIALCCPQMVFCQDITGIWKGTMYNDSTQQSLDCEIVISKVNGKFTGFSHTSFVINDKKYYGIKKINVRVAKEGKIVLQDAKMIETNYPDKQNKNVIQLDVLTLENSGAENYLNGIFVTNCSRDFNALTGRMSVKKINPLLSQSVLLKYLEQNTSADNLTVVK